MSHISSPQRCRVVNVPGFPGSNGADGTPGAPGANAFTTVTTAFTMPVVGGNVTIEVGDTSWMVPAVAGVFGQAIAVEFAGTFLVTDVVDANHVTLDNPGYDGNAPGGTTIPALARVGVSGVEGPAGSSPVDALLKLNNLSDVPVPSTARANLGLGDMALQVPSAVNITGGVITGLGTPLDIASGGTGGSTTPAARANLGLGSIATQLASNVAITGGAITGTPISGSTGSFTTLNVTVSVALPPSGVQSLFAGNQIAANAAAVKVVGNGGPITLGSTPTIDSTGLVDGQILLIRGTDDTNTITVQSASSLPGSQLKLGAATRVLAKNDQLLLAWDAGDACWYEVAFTDNQA